VRFTLAAALMAAFRPRALRHLQKDELLAGAALGFLCFADTRFRRLGCKILRRRNLDLLLVERGAGAHSTGTFLRQAARGLGSWPSDCRGRAIVFS
jgi:hypothetical protein